jgi:hypothetical protein
MVGRERERCWLDSWAVRRPAFIYRERVYVHYSTTTIEDKQPSQSQVCFVA